MSKNVKYLIVFLSLTLLFVLQSCTCCVYYNHMFNTERAFEEGTELRNKRLDTLSADSMWSTKEEREKWDKTIKKGSAILERYPDEEKHKPMAIFYIGEAFRMKGEYEKAITKYNEFEKYFASHDSISTVQYQRAFCYYNRKEYATARFALDPIFEKGETHPWYSESLELLALVDQQQDESGAAIATLEKLLASANVDDYMKAKAHYRLANLYFAEKDYIKAKAHFGVKLISLLTLNEQYLATYMSAECSILTKGYQQAAVELDSIVKNKTYKPYIVKSRIRYGETLLLLNKEPTAYSVLKDVIADSTAKVEISHAWFIMGDYEQSIKGDYPVAITYYDSCKAYNKYNEWAKKARERTKSLKQYLTYSKKKKNKNLQKNIKLEDDFMMAELFLFRLDEVDSALNKLDEILAKNQKDSKVTIQAAYAQAYIYDEFKNDNAKADSIYKYIIENYPNSKYAQQSQITLGLPQTVKTDENFAHEAFLNAERAFDSINTISVDSIALIDSLYAEALLKFDSVYINFPGTEYAAKALFTKAWIFENNESNPEKARVEYEILAKNYHRTVYGKKAQQKLKPKLKYSESQLANTRKLIDRNKLQDENRKKKKVEAIAESKKDKKIKSDSSEVLSNDYDDLYNLDE